MLPIDELWHPWPLLAAGVMVLNDVWLKRAGLLPGWLTGKLSDVAGLFFFPLLLTATWRTAQWAFTRQRPRLTERLLAAAIAVTCGVMIAIKTLPSARDLFESVVPKLDPTQTIGAATVVLDPTDLLALPVVWLTWRFGLKVVRGAPT